MSKGSEYRRGSRRWRRRAILAEAAILLVIARLLVLLVPIRYWRSSLGQPADVGSRGSGTCMPTTRGVRRAVNRAAGRLPLSLACLPRAMAVQWMLARRGTPSIFIIGAAAAPNGGQPPVLHAWVEAGGGVVIGEETSNSCKPSLALERVYT